MGYTQADAAYLAGYIDADGTVRLGKRKGWRNGKIYDVLAVMVTGTNRAALDWMQDMFGGSVGIHVKAGPRKGGIVARKPCYAWQVSARKAAHVLEAVTPCLIVKRRQAEVGLQFYAYAQACRAHRGKPLPLDYLETVERFRQHIRLWNARGVRERQG